MQGTPEQASVIYFVSMTLALQIVWYVYRRSKALLDELFSLTRLTIDLVSFVKKILYVLHPLI